MRYVHSLSASVQRVLLDSFNPPPGTRSIDAKLYAFVRMQANKESAKCMRIASTAPTNAVHAKCAGYPGPPVGAWSDADIDWWLNGTMFPQKRFREAQVESAKEFVRFWGLNEECEWMLFGMPTEVFQAVVTSFRPYGDGGDISRQILEHISKVRKRLASQAPRSMDAQTVSASSGAPAPPGVYAPLCAGSDALRRPADDARKFSDWSPYAHPACAPWQGLGAGTLGGWHPNAPHFHAGIAPTVSMPNGAGRKVSSGRVGPKPRRNGKAT